MLPTARLALVPATPAALRAELDGAPALSSVLGVTVPAEWPPDLYDRDAIGYTLARLEERPEEAGWWSYYVVLREAPAGPVAVGVCGYKGPPADGEVEIGYSVLGAYQRRGIATEATRALVTRAFARPEVHRVVAHTLPGLVPSIGVLERCDFRLTGPGAEEGTIRFERARA
jgi:RimJ/RimL family protein N-acetyltransferase